MAPPPSAAFPSPRRPRHSSATPRAWPPAGLAPPPRRARGGRSVTWRCAFPPPPRARRGRQAVDRPPRAPRLAEPAAAASFLAAPSPLARPPRPRHSLRHLARAAAARPPTGPLAPPPRRARGGRSGTWRCATWRRAVGPLVVALASAALILGDIGRASAFVVATPWKLQADELATVRLFKDNTPSVVYITNLVVHMADCLGWFVGLFLSRKLVQEGHQVTLFTRGKAPITKQLPGESDAEYAEFSSKVLHLKGDRKDFDFVRTSLSAKGFNVVYDINGREATESDLLPHFETDAVDRKSRHKGKLETQSLLETSGLKAGRPIPIPNAGNQITQLGHVKDLATAFIKVLGNPKASKQVYNISGSKHVTFDGIARACKKDFDFGKKKAFPFRDQHFFASVEKASKDLGVTPEYDLLDGLTDSYNLDFDRGTFRKEADFTTDDMILGKKLVSV
ncbi:hypothetical protein ZWY2020_034545 [Hordeum vulgare]|nr:hypothetical protein ZWY2020_034545 [Hordeum vulgare]